MTAKLNPAAEKLLALRQRIASELWQSPAYKDLITELRARRPSIPYWNPKQDNTAELQSASAAQKWHDVLMAIIDPEKYPKGDE